MSGQADRLDHVGIVGRDLGELAAAYARLGFRTTPLARHEGGRTGNHCIMLRDSYLELVATLPGGTSATLARFLSRYAGIHILALRIDDETAALARLARAGFPDLGATHTERALDDADPTGPKVGFMLVTPPDPPEGRVHLIHHLTPRTLWQERFLDHPNRVTGLASVTLLVEQPAATAAWLSRLAGRSIVVDGQGLALDLPRGRLRILPASARSLAAWDAPPAGARGSQPPSGTPPIAPPWIAPPWIAPPWIAGLTLHTDDDNRAVRGFLAECGMPHHIDGAAIITRQDDLFLRFEPAPS